MSVEEGMAMVQLEAMACGLPVICATNTGGEDVVRNGIEGFVIPIRDIRALKERLVYLYEDPKALAQMSRNAKKRVSSGFTWDDYGKKIIKTYQKILA
jgi:glycosyltransferase involved in cell wall biosynthesis